VDDGTDLRSIAHQQARAEALADAEQSGTGQPPPLVPAAEASQGLAPQRRMPAPKDPAS
jgi:hypothetical protein